MKMLSPQKHGENVSAKAFILEHLRIVSIVLLEAALIVL